MSDPTKAQIMLGRVIDDLNQLVLAGNDAEVHHLIEIARKHLEARYYQTRPVGSELPEPYEIPSALSAETPTRSIDPDEDLL